MRKLALLVLVVVFGWSSGAGALPVEWSVTSGGNGHWYDSIQGAYTWHEAKADAEARGGYLATATSLTEWEIVRPYGGWLGLYQYDNSSEPAAGWGWVTGEPYIFTKWIAGEPNDAGGNEDAALVHHSYGGGGWGDYPASWTFRYIIEYDTNPIPEPSTALLLGIGMMGLGMRRRRR